MQKKSSSEVIKKIAPILKFGGIGVVPTDTMYGVVGSALKKSAVERIYHVRRRDLKKPFIILVSSVLELKKFGINLNDLQKKALEDFWPGKVSVVLPCKNKKFEYLHRSKKTLAFRFPGDEELIKLLKKVGPLVAPSANRAGDEPATTFSKARQYFTDEVDFYVDGGKLKSKPSTIIEIGKDGKIEVLRQGAVKIK
jgi:L-threonylcarbamoyladenylate synthase